MRIYFLLFLLQMLFSFRNELFIHNLLIHNIMTTKAFSYHCPLYTLCSATCFCISSWMFLFWQYISCFFLQLSLSQIHSKCKFHSQFQCSTCLHVTLDLKTKPMYFLRTYTRFSCLHNKSGSKIESMIHPPKGKGRNP